MKDRSETKKRQEGLPGNEVPHQDMAERRKAISLFLNDPEEACRLYPGLADELVTFFSQSSNPHADMEGIISAGRESNFEQWDAIRRWAESRPRN